MIIISINRKKAGKFMYNIDFNKPCHIFFCGIGGISMSGFAHLLRTMGFTISGSDSTESEITKQLTAEGIHIAYPQRAENITEDTELFVYTAAIHSDNPEFIKAKELNIPMMERATMVGQVMKNYKNAISISGTHGKTTTTSMISHIFLEAEADPTISVGGILKAINGNIRVGHSENFITEACEYTNSFLKFYPTVAIVLNIEEDHMDFFKDIDDIRHSFREFVKLVPENGMTIINAQIDNYEEIIEGLSCKCVTYGLNNKSLDYNAANITYNEKGYGSYDLYNKDTYLTHINLGVVGEHNVSNSLSAIACALGLSISMDDIKRGLMAFSGTVRRFEYKGTVNGIEIIDDYAHHPTEIKATLNAAGAYPHNNLWVVFQPHTYTRTRAFLDDFATALSLADKIVLADIYAAREPDPGDISSKDLLQKLQALGKESYYFSTFDEIEKFLLKNCIQGDLLITMGAGNIVNIADSLVKKI